MKIGIIGSGGREHALCYKLKQSSKIKKIYCFPGNAGTRDISENIEIDIDNFELLKNFILEKKIDYIIVGPEKPLVNGLVDYLEKYKIKVFGPNKIASQLEGSKIFTKKLCEDFKIPTAEFGVFNKIDDAVKYVSNKNFPIVIKADGLASGKGVYIVENLASAVLSINEIFNGKFGVAKQILIEEFIDGEEMSYFIISDGKTFQRFQTAQDHKRVSEGDTGKNTGGMGAYSPSGLLNKDLDQKIIKKVIEPTLMGLKAHGTNYKGFLYAGLMIRNNEPYLIEYNVRMGDPECQTILPKLENDFFEIIQSCIDERLNTIQIKWSENKSICIVVCSNGYPDNFENEVEITGLENLTKEVNSNQLIFHAGTKYINRNIFSNGGRVLNFVTISENFKTAREQSISLIKKLNWKNGFYRKDIGHRVIK
jgi:phosphoribosylamine--glycine ligase